MVEITAASIRRCIQEGRWQGQLPGVRPLAEEFSVSKDTVRAALALLQKENLLAAGGAGRFREILGTGHPSPATGRVLRVALLLRLPLEQLSALSQGHMLALLHEVRMAGHHAFVAPRYLKHPGKYGRLLEKLVAETQADAWVAYSASHEVLAWFAEHQIPIFALGGHPMALDIPWACSDLTRAMQDTVARLVNLGHRRIVLITSEKWLKPKTNAAALAFSECLRAHGLNVTDYNLPDWPKTRDGLEGLLHSLFQTTPPTALLILDPSWTVATLGWLLKKNISVPQQVSVISLMPDPALKL